MSAPLSPIFSLFLVHSGTLFLKLQDVLARDKAYDANPLMRVGKRRPGPKHPKYGIPTEHWKMIMHHVVEKNEPPRAVGQEYGVSSFNGIFSVENAALPS